MIGKQLHKKIRGSQRQTRQDFYYHSVAGPVVTALLQMRPVSLIHQQLDRDIHQQLDRDMSS